MPFQINGNMSSVCFDALFWQTAMSYDYELIAPVQFATVKDVTDNKNTCPVSLPLGTIITL